MDTNFCLMCGNLTPGVIKIGDTPDKWFPCCPGCESQFRGTLSPATPSRVTWTPPDISKNPTSRPMEFKMDKLTKKLTESGACQCQFYGCDAKNDHYPTHTGKRPGYNGDGNPLACNEEATTVVTDEDETPIPCCRYCASQMVTFGGGYFHYTESKGRKQEARGITIPSPVKSKINAGFTARGLDGNGHFLTIGEAFSRIEDVLQMFSITLAESYVHRTYLSDDGRWTLDLVLNGEQVRNSVLVFSWHQRYPYPSDSPKDYEIIAYVS